MSEIESHFEDIVVRSWVNYIKCEKALSRAHAEGDTVEVDEARKEVVLSARSACIEMHQFVDTICAQKADPPAWLPEDVKTLDEIRRAVSGHCRMLRQNELCADVDVLHDIADAFKHSILIRPRKGREHWVKNSKCSVVIASGFGELRFGEGKFGGVQQLIVRLDNGQSRALSSVLQNVIDAWRRFMGQELPDFSE
jgi:hypothetical protein